MTDSKPPTSTSTSQSNDTSHRRTWDRTLYAQKASDRSASLKLESAARAEAKSQGKKYFRPVSPSSLHDSSSRARRLDVTANVGKTTLVPASATTGKRGKGAGFYCQECDLTFKDNLQFVEHLNSRQHLVNSGESGEVRKATLEEVQERLRMLGERKREERREEESMRLGLGDQGLEGRLKIREEEGEREREERRRKRREKRRKTEGGVGVKVEEGYGGGIIS